MSDDPLNRARRKLLASTSAMLDTLTAEDVGGTFRSIAPGLEAARATGRTSAVTAILGRVGDQVATEIGVDLGWDFLDATPWTGQQVRAAYAGRLNRVADWLTEQLSAGRDAEELLIWTRNWQQAIAGSDVHQVAREATIVVAGNSPVIGRVQRIAEPGACAWCRMMSSRGAVYVTEATALSSGHAHCRCEIATVTNPKAIEQSRQAGQEAWRASELSSSKSPFRNRRGGGPRPDPDLFKPGAKTAERETAIRAQIASYEQTLPGLRKAVADGDEAQRKALDWQEAKAAELRAELAGLPDAPGPSRQRPRAPIVGTSSSRRDRFAMSMGEARISSVLDDRVRDLALSPVASTLRAVERYQDGGHTLLNRVLWQAPESLQRLGDADLGRFRSMLNGLQWLSREFGSPGITVWRGIPTSRDLAVNRLVPGDELPRLKGFISTSVGESVARSFLGDGPKRVLYRLSVPEGTPGAWLPPFGPEKWRWQAEFLLPPNCSILVTGVDLSGRVPIVLGEVTF